MRSLAIWGLAAAAAAAAMAVPAEAESGWKGSTTVASGMGDVPTLPLNPPRAAQRAPQGGWGSEGWRGQERNRSWGGHDGWSGRRFGPGAMLPRYWVSQRFAVRDWRGYGFPAPGYGRSWVRYYDDAYLIDGYGRILDTAYDVDWGRGAFSPPDEGYGHDARFIHAPPGSTTIIIQSAPIVTTTTTTVYEDVGYAAKKRRAWRAQPKCACR